MSWVNYRKMEKLFTIRETFSVFVLTAVLFIPIMTYADGISLVADLEYIATNDTRTEKETGIVTATDSSRFSQLYKLDLNRFVYPNVAVNFGGYFENEDIDTTSEITGEMDTSSSVTERTIRPYVELNLYNPLYKAGLAYRTRDTETSVTPGSTDNLLVDEYNAVLNWRPVDLPLLNIDFQRTEIHDDPATFDRRSDLLNLTTKYGFKDFFFDYSFYSQDNTDNLEGTGNLNKNHTGRVLYSKGFDYADNRFDVRAGAKIIYNTIEFTDSNDSGSSVDVPAVNPGTSFFILDDASPASNDTLEVTLVDGANPLSGVNVGRNGGLAPVSIGLGFGVPTQVDTIYIQLSEDRERFPELATTSQVSAIAGSFDWRFYSSDDQVELNWTEHPVASATYNSVDNRFEVRISEPINTRRIKITTTPLTVVAPGEIRYSSIRAFTSVTGNSGEEPENLNQFYNFSVQWSYGARTTVGYENYYRIIEAKHLDAKRTSWSNGVNFRHILNPIFLTYGRLNRDVRTRSTQQEEVEETDLTYSLGLKGAYLETLSQSLVFTGTDISGAETSSRSNSILLRTDADLYEGWTVNLDLGYSLENQDNNIDQSTKFMRLSTNIQPNRSLDFNLDYTLNATEITGESDQINQYGTFQALWSVTDTLNLFFRYNFRVQEGDRKTSTYIREVNLNWAPFPGGAFQFTVNYNVSQDFGNREIKAISPILTWRIGQGIFLNLKYTNGTVDTPLETEDYDTYSAKLRIFY